MSGERLTVAQTNKAATVALRQLGPINVREVDWDSAEGRQIAALQQWAEAYWKPRRW